MKSYSDGEMLLATQIAYLDVKESQKNNRYSLRKITDDRYLELLNKENQGELSEAEKSQKSTIENIRKMAEDQGVDLNSWKIRDIDNDEHGSGMYGCLIDTGDGSAIVGFRGSESIDAEQKIKDWGLADLGLLNNPCTAQQARAQQFMEKINQKYADDYFSFSITGHSLGGNLASHAMITANEPLSEKVDRCINFDGPGVSDEYLAFHAADIQQNGGKIEHFQWSAVGTLLLPIPNSSYRTIDAETPSPEQHSGFPVELARHDTMNVLSCLVDGYAKEGDQDLYSRVLGPVSKAIETIDIRWHPEILIFEMFAGVIGYVNNMMEDIGNAINSIRDSVQDWFNSVFGTVVNEEFEVTPKALYESADYLGSAERELESIISRTNEIVSDLKYYSLSGFYYKNKLRYSANSLRNDMEKIRRIEDCICSCAARYEAVDASVAQLYSL